MKICVLRIGGMGDILLATPTIRALSQYYQTDQIDFVVGPGMDAALTGLFYVRNIHRFEREKNKYLALTKALKAERYDLFLNFQPSLKTLGLMLFCAPKQMIVFKKDRRKQKETNRVRHAIDDFAKEIRPLGIEVRDRQLDFFVPETARQSLAEKIVLGQKYIAINPAGTRDINRWPAQNFAALIDRLADELPQYKITLLGGPNDIALSEEIASMARNSVVMLAGKLSVKELGALLENASCVVTGDTGPLHIASAVKAPIVCLSGAADPDRTGPTRPNDLVVIQRELDCVPCQGRSCHRGDIACMTQMPVARVFEAIQIRLQK
jgi:heptosyltransferase II